MSTEENTENKVKIYPFITRDMDKDYVARAKELKTSKGIEIEKDWQIARSFRDLLRLTKPNSPKPKKD